MGDVLDPRGSTVGPPPLDIHAAQIPRRRVLKLIGVTAFAGGSLGLVLEGCVGPPIPVTLDFDLHTLETGQPVLVEFDVPMGDSNVEGSVWFVRQASGTVDAFDPRCTHALCAYVWEDDDRRFRCYCHEGQFAIDGAVLDGPPPRPLDRWVMTETAAGVEVMVPGNFRTPRESLPE